LIEYIYAHARNLGLKVRNNQKMQYHTNVGIGRPNPLIAKLKGLDLIHNKHIPEIYLRNSKEVRLQVLAGLIDTDGHLASATYEIHSAK
jgi:hypothetical protein